MSVTLHTSKGDVKMELHCQQCPKTCENFLALAASGYYDNCIFHRNMPKLMIQTGDKTGTGKGGKCLIGDGDALPDEYVAQFHHISRGVVSMANKGPNTATSQFFILYDKQPRLDGKFVIFGQVIDGWKTLERMENVSVHKETFRPFEDIILNTITIHANPFAENQIKS
ncbi:hypothetical protein SNEBB_008090 [Seison nebaliae]|nr:hypothetical protein SNEBB_008090 [Seison nebaliae]